jgi:hypothetical protein
LIGKYAFDFGGRRALAPQVKSVLSKIMDCRTAILDGHFYQCPSCDSQINMHDSCGDRHCPQWAKLQDKQLGTWLDELSATNWNVFIEGPPQQKSDPQQVLKYLARYYGG